MYPRDENGKASYREDNRSIIHQKSIIQGITAETCKDKGISNYNQLTTSHFNFQSAANSAAKGQGLSRLNDHQRPNRGFNPAHKWKQKQSKSEHAL